MPLMQTVIERPHLMAQNNSREDVLSRDALWVIEVLAHELAGDAGADRSALVEALLRHAGYEQADALWPKGHQALQAALVARLAERLAKV